jgi:hypothetical protein
VAGYGEETQMELPQFNSQATGPQGTAGIPPERFQEALQRRGVDLIGANMRPEDSQAVQAVLDQEAAALQAQQQPHQNVAPQAPVIAPDTPQGTPPAPRATPQDDLMGRIATVREKYQTFDELAKAHVHATAGMTQAQQERNGEIATLSREIAGLKAQIAMATAPTPQRQPSYEDAFQPPQGQPGPQQARTQPPQGHPQPGQAASGFWDNPEGVIEGIVQRQVQSNLIAMKEAEARMDRTKRFEDEKRTNAADITRLQPRIQQLYGEFSDVYDSMPADRALALALKTARAEEAADAGRWLYSQMPGGALPNAGNTAPDGNGVPLGALPGGGSSGRQVTPPGPPQGNWGNTVGMKQLWNSGDGSVNETRALTEVLRERGFGEDVKI